MVDSKLFVDLLFDHCEQIPQKLVGVLLFTGKKPTLNDRMSCDERYPRFFVSNFSKFSNCTIEGTNDSVHLSSIRMQIYVEIF